MTNRAGTIGTFAAALVSALFISGGVLAQPADPPDDAAGDAAGDAADAAAGDAAAGDAAAGDAAAGDAEAKPAPGVDPTPDEGRPQEEPPPAEGAEQPPAPQQPPPPSKDQQEMVAEAEQGGSNVELPGKTYRFVGARYRGVIVPKFMMNLFGDGGTTVYNHGGGPEFTIRKDGFEYVFSIWYASYAMDETPFKASSDGENAWEIVKSDLKAVFLTTDFLWSQEFVPEFAINYGLSAGFGFVFGDLFRTQAYPPSGQAGDPEDYVKCNGVGDPDPNYCGDDNDHYSGYTEPSWTDGGSKPVIFPWLAFQTGFRSKLHKNFVLRVDAGFGTSGFFIGAGANYGL